MSIIPASRLSRSDLCRLGNNLAYPRPLSVAACARHKRRRLLAAVNRSLACIGERVTRLHRPLMASANSAAESASIV